MVRDVGFIARLDFSVSDGLCGLGIQLAAVIFTLKGSVVILDQADDLGELDATVDGEDARCLGLPSRLGAAVRPWSLVGSFFSIGVGH